MGVTEGSGSQGPAHQGGRWSVRTRQVLEFLEAWERRCSTHPSEPSLSLKEFARRFPQMGSRDRKEWSLGIYQAWRARRVLGKAASWEECLLAGLVAVLGQDAPWVLWLKQCYQHHEEVASAMELRGHEGFPLAQGVSSRLNREVFFREQGRAGSAWLRVRASRTRELADYFVRKDWTYRAMEPVHPSSVPWALPLGLPLQECPGLEGGWFELQDLSCQQLLSWMPPKPHGRWLDACAGSGGKTLLMHDAWPELQWFVTDLRESALQELSKRFARVGWKQYSRACVDWIAQEPGGLGSFPDRFEGVLLDAPCSGSGSWRNQPQAQLRAESAGPEVHASQQEQLLRRLWTKVREQGYLLYVTCSVYALENEDRIQGFLAENSQAQLLRDGYLDASEQGGDVLYAALLQKAGSSSQA